MDPSTHGIRGLASVFGNLDAYDTIVDRGAFAREVKAFRAGETLPLVSRHNTLRDPRAEPIGVVTYLEETDEGLYFEARLDDTQVGRDALTRAESGSGSDASFSFQPVRTYMEEGRRVIRKSGLYAFFGDDAWEKSGGRDLWTEWSGRGLDGTDHERIVLPTREAMAMIKAAKKIKGWGELDPIHPLRVIKIEHLSEVGGVKELGPSPARLGANPKAYAEAFDLAEAKEQNNAAPTAADNNPLADALALAAQEIAQ
jgi:HK97 family phage prohead protease